MEDPRLPLIVRLRLDVDLLELAADLPSFVVQFFHKAMTSRQRQTRARAESPELGEFYVLILFDVRVSTNEPQ